MNVKCKNNAELNNEFVKLDFVKSTNLLVSKNTANTAFRFSLGDDKSRDVVLYQSNGYYVIQNYNVFVSLANSSMCEFPEGSLVSSISVLGNSTPQISDWHIVVSTTTHDITFTGPNYVIHVNNNVFTKVTKHYTVH